MAYLLILLGRGGQGGSSCHGRVGNGGWERRPKGLLVCLGGAVVHGGREREGEGGERAGYCC